VNIKVAFQSYSRIRNPVRVLLFFCRWLPTHWFKLICSSSSKNGFSLINLGGAILLLCLLTACQPTNTTVGRSIKKGTSSGSDLHQLRITNNQGQPLAGSETQINVGDTLQFRANLFSLDDVFINTVAVRWSLKSISGSITSGLSCGSAATDTCSFTPMAPGTIYLEALLLDQTSRLVSYTHHRNLGHPKHPSLVRINPDSTE
jgi:hypothetical protein